MSVDGLGGLPAQRPSVDEVQVRMHASAHTHTHTHVYTHTHTHNCGYAHARRPQAMPDEQRRIEALATHVDAAKRHAEKVGGVHPVQVAPRS